MGETGHSVEPRAKVAEGGLMAEASAHLTEEVAVHLPFEALAAFKTALKRYFSRAEWSPADAAALSDLVVPHLEQGWWEHDLGQGLTLRHGIRRGSYHLEVLGTADSGPSVFDRAFTGPVRPEQTPHPRKVKFNVGGEPAPGVWYRRGESITDPRVTRLMEDSDVTDVMVAGDFVTVGLHRSVSWEERLDQVLSRVTELFWTGGASAAPARTRDDLLDEAGRLHLASIRPEDLHLLDPDREDHRRVLLEALRSDDARARRAAVVTLALAGDAEVAGEALATGYRDRALIVRRAAVDAAADLEDDEYRSMFEKAVADRDPWIRWRAVRAISVIGADPSRETLARASADADFRVRFEAEAALRTPR